MPELTALLLISLAGNDAGVEQRTHLEKSKSKRGGQECPPHTNKNQAGPLCRVTGPRMNPSVDVGCPPRPFRHLRMAQRRTPDLCWSRAPVDSALVQKSVTRHHQPGRPAFIPDARQSAKDWQV